MDAWDIYGIIAISAVVALIIGAIVAMIKKKKS